MKLNRKESTRHRHKRIRKKLQGTSERPRLAVFRSHQHIYAQVIDDSQHVTLVSASTLDPELKNELSMGRTCQASSLVGEVVAKRSLDKGIRQVVFDRGGKLYHGRIKALAEAAREAGLEF